MDMARPAELTLLLHPDCGFAAITAMLEELGWRRDPDRTNVATDTPGEPSFASWSRGYGDDGEVDYAFDPETERRLLTLRGEDAAGRRAAIAERLEIIATGEELADLTEALAPLLAAMAAGAGAPADEQLRRSIARIGEGEARWQLLRRTLRLGGEIPRALLALLFGIALADGDWRVRMTAMIGAGRFLLGELAEAVAATVVPAAEPCALGNDDRRILLAARATVGEMLSDSPPAPPESEPSDEIAAARAAFRRRLAGFIRGEADEHVDKGPFDRAPLLVTALIAPERLPARGSFPDQWYAWLPAASQRASRGR
jgi:hypothetical protein